MEEAGKEENAPHFVIFMSKEEKTKVSSNIVRKTKVSSNIVRKVSALI